MSDVATFKLLVRAVNTIRKQRRLIDELTAELEKMKKQLASNLPSPEDHSHRSG